MYMSRIRLDLSRQETMQALKMPQKFHGAFEASYEGERRRNLWRLDINGENHNLLVVSREQPEFDNVAEQFGYGAKCWECKNYTPFLKKLSEGSRWRFRLCANPIISLPSDGDRGRIHAHLTPEHQCKWLLARAQKHGFLLEENEFGVVDDRWLIFKKGGKGADVRIRQVTFSGVLTVTNADAFRALLTEGIGKGKAYGCGMMTVVSCDR